MDYKKIKKRIGDDIKEEDRFELDDEYNQYLENLENKSEDRDGLDSEEDVDEDMNCCCNCCCLCNSCCCCCWRCR